MFTASWRDADAHRGADAPTAIFLVIFSRFLEQSR